MTLRRWIMTAWPFQADGRRRVSLLPLRAFRLAGFRRSRFQFRRTAALQALDERQICCANHIQVAEEAAGTAMATLLAPRVSLLLYLCAVNSEISNTCSTGRRPADSQFIKTKRGVKLFPASGPTRWIVRSPGRRR